MPVFAFNDETGRQWRVTSRVGNGASPYHVGDTVMVFYAAQNPAVAQIGDISSTFGVTAVLAFCAVFCLVLGYLLSRATPFEITIGGRGPGDRR